MQKQSNETEPALTLQDHTRGAQTFLRAGLLVGTLKKPQLHHTVDTHQIEHASKLAQYIMLRVISQHQALASSNQNSPLQGLNMRHSLP